eukprot:jgi/Ulvmu1/10306/UM060_0108.1
MMFTTSFRPRATCARTSTVPRAWQKLTTLPELKEAKFSRVVVPVDGVGKILVQELDGEVYAVSNKCTHLGLPLQGKIVGQEVVDGCVVCPFHNNAFDIKTGEVQGEWAPGFPKLPLVGKIKETAPLPTYATRVDGDSVEVDV